MWPLGFFYFCHSESLATDVATAGNFEKRASINDTEIATCRGIAVEQETLESNLISLVLVRSSAY